MLSGKISNDNFDRPQHGQTAERAFVQVFADGVLQHGDIGHAIVFGDADVVGEMAQGLGRDPLRRRRPEMEGMRGSSQP